MKDWLTQKTIIKNIDGQDVEFRRIPVGILQKCRNLNESVAKALAMVFRDTAKDVEINQVSVPSEKMDAEGKPVMSTEFKQASINPSLASQRVAQTEAGIKSLIDALTSEDTMKIVSEIIVASAYKEFSKEDTDKIKDNMDIGTVIQFLKGAFEASAGDYAKLGKSLFQANPQMQEMADRVKATLVK